jgi:acetyl esterase/lipase
MAARDQSRKHPAAVSNPAVARQQISLRARLIRLPLRWLLKYRTLADMPVPAVRRRVRFLTRLVPRPPRGTQIVTIDLGGVPGERISVAASHSDRHVLYLHGGAYLAGSPALYRDFTWRIATVARARVWCIDYRLAPEHPFPAAVDDAAMAYRALLNDGAAPGRTVLMGESAGGGLVFATLLKLRDEGTPLPTAAVAMSPWTDLALAGGSLQVNATVDPMISVESLPGAVDNYLAGADPRHPYASPIYGDATGLPPALILVGGDEVLRDDAVRMAEAMRAAGRDVALEVWPRMVHAWPMMARVLPEARAAITRIGAFLDGKL